MIKSKHQQAKEQAKQSSRRRSERRERIKAISNLSDKDRIHLDMTTLLTHITNCKYDLEHQFKGNILIEKKLQVAKARYVELKNKLEEFNNENI